MKKEKHQHPDHTSQLSRVNRIMGQLEGIKKMIQEGRYCPEIMQQTRAVNSAVKALEVALLQTHLDSCIRESAKTDPKAIFDKKLRELLQLIRS